MQNNSPKILILGTNGMLGQTVFAYFSNKFQNSTWGTGRKKAKNIFAFDAYDYYSLKKIFKSLNSVDYVINCIGILRNANSLKDQIFINAYFPHILEDFAIKYNFLLIHVSTDAVFSPEAGKVTESTNPSPINSYGMSKYLGETQSTNAITIRTSILGINKLKSTGFLNWIMSNKGNDLFGFTNQTWNGCTTLQFAQFCDKLISKNAFHMLRKSSPIFHFAPISATTKYQIAEVFINEIQYKTPLKKSKGETISRELDTQYADILSSYYQKSSIQKALHELALFEKLKS